MTHYRDPSAPSGRVVFGGEEFVDGVTADITPGSGTAELFAAAGITPDTIPATEVLADSEGLEPDTPAPRRKK